MRTALAAAPTPAPLGQVATLGRMVTGLFLRSYERGERVYVAMVARGYVERCRACPCWRSGAPTPCSSCSGADAGAAARAGRGGFVIVARGLRYRYPNGVVGSTASICR